MRYTYSMPTDFKRRLIISTSIILGSAVAATFAIYFLGNSIGGLAKKIVAEKASINQKTGALAVFAALKQQSAQAAVYQTAIDGLLPTQNGLIGFTQWVSGIAATHQVAVNVSFQGGGASFVPASDTAADFQNIGQTDFSISASGGINNLTAFLNDIESESPGFLLQITSFNIANNGGNYQFSGQGVVFFRQ